MQTHRMESVGRPATVRSLQELGQGAPWPAVARPGRAPGGILATMQTQSAWEYAAGQSAWEYAAAHSLPCGGNMASRKRPLDTQASVWVLMRSVNLVCMIAIDIFIIYITPLSLSPFNCVYMT